MVHAGVPNGAHPFHIIAGYAGALQQHAHKVIDGVADPALVEHRDIPGAGHFAFMSKFPPEMTRPGFKPSQDPAGFDREAIQPQFFADVTAFLRRTLCAAPSSATLY